MSSLPLIHSAFPRGKVFPSFLLVCAPLTPHACYTLSSDTKLPSSAFPSSSRGTLARLVIRANLLVKFFLHMYESDLKITILHFCSILFHSYNTKYQHNTNKTSLSPAKCQGPSPCTSPSRNLSWKHLRVG